MKFKYSFTPGHIGAMELRNRYVMAPMATRFALDDGLMNDSQIAYYVRRARGGAALIITEATYLTPRHFKLLLNEDRFIPGFRKLADAVHAAGAKIAVQLTCGHGLGDTVDPVSASAMNHPVTNVRCRELSTDEIKDLGRNIAHAALRAKTAGIDAIELHGAHGYLPAQFLSPLTNKRADAYGGSLTNRLRFPRELVEATRDRVGKDVPLMFRISATEYVKGGIELEDAIFFCQALEQAGLDAIDVSAGSWIWSPEWVRLPKGSPPASRASLAEAIKKNLSIPVIVAGSISDPFQAEDIIQTGKADFVSLGRPLLADPEFAAKAGEDRPEDIRACMYCDGCRDRMQRGNPINCALNP
jgi:2,4-dienoyl-CoA reductase-like NADH-dependent reductase (Old Yellow Enzyme family)